MLGQSHTRCQNGRSVPYLAVKMLGQSPALLSKREISSLPGCQDVRSASVFAVKIVGQLMVCNTLEPVACTQLDDTMMLRPHSQE